MAALVPYSSVMTRFSACLFLIGTLLCSIPGMAAERRSDMTCVDGRLQSAGERNARDRATAGRAVIMPAIAREAADSTPALSLSRNERAELKQALERFAAEGKLIDIRQPEKHRPGLSTPTELQIVQP